MGSFILGVAVGAIIGVLWYSGPELLKSMVDTVREWRAKR